MGYRIEIFRRYYHWADRSSRWHRHCIPFGSDSWVWKVAGQSGFLEECRGISGSYRRTKLQQSKKRKEKEKEAGSFIQCQLIQGTEKNILVDLCFDGR